MSNALILLDSSSSMIVLGKEPLYAISNFVTETKSEYVTLWTFNDTPTLEIDNKPVNTTQIQNIPYTCRGFTGLYDAICTMLSKTKYSQNTNCLIITDGYENASKTYTKTDVCRMIQEREQDGWKFVFIGVGSELEMTGQELGLKNCTTFDNECVGSLTRVIKTASDFLNNGSSGKLENLNIGVSNNTSAKLVRTTSSIRLAKKQKR